MRGNLLCFLDFYLVGMEKILKVKKPKGEKNRNDEKTKKQKGKEKKTHQGAGAVDFRGQIRL